MVLVKRIRRRGANIVVEAHGEVLFAATGDVGRWTNRFSHRTRNFAAAAAPNNKRPRWGHYGKPLKSTFSASTTYQPGRMKVYSAIGSSSAHGTYVDQGTGIFAGKGAYEAKILPPWHRGSPSLYENTWRPGGLEGRKVAPVMIKGQRGQFFFAKGLERANPTMRMRSFQVPGDAKITQALATIPSELLGFMGNTPANDAFVASLKEWRTWRDTSWRERRMIGGRKTLGPDRRDATDPRKPKRKADPAGLKASQAAAERRRKAQVERLRKANEAKALGKKRKAEADAKFHNEQAKRHARMLGLAFAKGKKDVHASWGVDTDTGLAAEYRITYTTKKGKRKTKVFPV